MRWLLFTVLLSCSVRSGLAQLNADGLNRQYRLVDLPQLVASAEHEMDSLKQIGVAIDRQDAWDYVRFPATYLDREPESIPDGLRATVEFVVSKRTRRQFADSFNELFWFQFSGTEYPLPVHPSAHRALRQVRRTKSVLQLYGIFLGHVQSDGTFRWTVLVEYALPAKPE